MLAVPQEVPGAQAKPVLIGAGSTYVASYDIVAALA
jgi:hypothetical protein